MARGVKKPITEKITAKEEIIKALSIRLESEKRELKEMYDEKRQRELEAVSDLINESGLSTDEVSEILKNHTKAV